VGTANCEHCPDYSNNSFNKSETGITSNCGCSGAFWGSDELETAKEIREKKTKVPGSNFISVKDHHETWQLSCCAITWLSNHIQVR
jgi:hypothetical protein